MLAVFVEYSVFNRNKQKKQEDKNYNCTTWKHFLEEKMQLFMKEKAKTPIKN
ncbi:MAG: hypothetical protein GTN53_09165 [Candidatus Aminicenantes bacterium]|nr:hypothetical protein [Candidatus Aminicenantes bacterium]NIQ66628.1 hypothetical protein [Candidatus Aminicenantes bacterium]NIT22658.1 hypothetical protein [Candidatus Aminicenantes bacterium]